MDIKNEILWRIYVVALLIILCGTIIFLKAVTVSVWEGDKWTATADSLYLDYRPVNAERGNIFAEDGSLLATSLPYFEIRMDMRSSAMSTELLEQNIDTLAQCLAALENSRFTAGGYLEYLREAHERGDRYLLIRKNVTYPELERIREFPLFNLGRYKGGLIVHRKSRRVTPFRMLAHRTVGYVRPNIRPVGLEGAFNKELAGEQGQQLMQRIAGNNWIPVDDITAIEPRNGQDIITTIDINLQDITENALHKAIRYHNARHGCAIIMETKTGKIRAIANIGHTEDGNLWETYNYAIGEATEPGSTVKLAAIMALMEDGYITSLEDSINLNLGQMEFGGELMEDATYHLLEQTTIRKAFEISSNVGIAQLAHKYYHEGQREERFIKRLQNFQLSQKTTIEIEGEASPYIKEAFTDNWSGTTIPWMSIGYELELTPLQMLTFYNAVANDGKMMKPYLVEGIQEYGQLIKKFEPQVIRKTIASKKTIRMAHELLYGVVERGTAKKIKSDDYLIAGKTGTAILNYKKDQPKSHRKYQGSFVGFFPADNPQYTCIVVINTPRVHGIYGSQVAAPVFREIADKCYATHIEMHEPVNSQARPILVENNLPKNSQGYTTDFAMVLNWLEIPYRTNDIEWSKIEIEQDTTNLQNIIQAKKIDKEDVIPDVRGLGLRDALYLLGQVHLKVDVNGTGRVVTQSILPGTAARGQTIKINLK